MFHDYNVKYSLLELVDKRLEEGRFTYIKYDVKGEGTMKSRAISALRLNAELYLSMLASFVY